MRTQYQHLINNPEPPALKPAEQAAVGKYLWSNFNRDVVEVERSPSEDLLKKCLKRAIYDQGGNFQDAPSQLLSYMSLPDVQHYATHLYVWIQLCSMLQNAYQGQNYLDDFRASPYFNKAFEQANPYILRYHVFALHNRMHALMTTEKNPNDSAWEKKRTDLYAETIKTGKKVAELIPTHPAFAHFLSGYCHYTLAMAAHPEHTMKHWEAAYTDFLWCEATEKKYPRASFIVNLGQGLYKDMPYDNLTAVKQPITAILGPEKTQELAIRLNNRLDNK